MKKDRETVSFTSKGQIVIPAWIRKKFQIAPGTRAIVQTTSDGILLRPVTRRAIEKLHGIVKPKPGAKRLAKEWAEHKRQERELETALK